MNSADSPVDFLRIFQDQLVPGGIHDTRSMPAYGGCGPNMHYAVISAHRKECSAKENKKRHEQLRRALDNPLFPHWYLEQIGFYQHKNNGPLVKEKSFLVYAIIMKAAVDFGKLLYPWQDSIIWDNSFVIINKKSGTAKRLPPAPGIYWKMMNEKQFKAQWPQPFFWSYIPALGVAWTLK